MQANNTAAYFGCSGADPIMYVINEDAGGIRFQTNGANDRVTIDDTGMGIGTTAPSQILHVVEVGRLIFDGSDSPLLSIQNNTATGSTSGTASLVFNQASASAGGKIVSGRDSDYSTSANRDSFMSFYTSLNATDTERMRVASGGQVSQPVTTITPSSSATVTYAVDMDASNIQNLVCHEDNADITINVSNMAAGKTVKLHVDFSSVSSFSSLTVNWNNNQVYEPDTAAAMVDGIGDDMINATYTNFMVDLTAYGTSASDVYGSATVFA